MLRFKKGQFFQSGVSYIDLVEFIMQKESNVSSDLEKLWRRIVFFICASNTDDHLRNHGFLLTSKGGELSPTIEGEKLNQNQLPSTWE